ncbi:unnamed protein product, partial [marine sediment metagenome]
FMEEQTHYTGKQEINPRNGCGSDDTSGRFNETEDNKGYIIGPKQTLTCPDSSIESLF